MSARFASTDRVGIRAAREQRPQGARQRARAGVDQLEVADQHALFGQVAREGGHRARRDAAQLGVVRPAGREEQQLAGRVVHRRNDRNVGQVRAAAIGIVRDEHVARP